MDIGLYKDCHKCGAVYFVLRFVCVKLVTAFIILDGNTVVRVMLIDESDVIAVVFSPSLVMK